MRRFSQSSERISINQQFIDRMEKEENSYLTERDRWPIKSEVYRRKFAIILKRLRETGKTSQGYLYPEELVRDLKEIKESAEAHLPKTKKN